MVETYTGMIKQMIVGIHQFILIYKKIKNKKINNKKKIEIYFVEII